MILRRLPIVLAAILMSMPVWLHAQAPASISIQVKETAGIRRTRFPATARVPLPRGAIKEAPNARLMLGTDEVEAQILPDGKYPDGSIQALTIDFNATIGPVETQTYRLEYGDAIKQTVFGRGVTANDAMDALELGRLRLSTVGAPLLESLNYRKEMIGRGMNGFTVSATSGTVIDFSKAQEVTAEIVKPGPVYGIIRYTGRLQIDASTRAPFTMTVEMPNSKAWVKYTASVDDPGRKLKEISFEMPFAFAAFPWLWDFGTGSWTYGSIRNAADSVILTQTVGAGAATKWEIRTGKKGEEQAYEVSAGSRPSTAEGWGHIQDAGEVVAFGVENFGKQPGRYTVALDGEGHTAYRFAPAAGTGKLQLAVYQHYVASPTPIGAVTSPPSMLSPLAVTVGPARK